jgi:hypothetical protein
MNYQYEQAKLSPEEITEIYRNIEAKGLSHVYCQACSEEIIPEQARKSSTGLIMCKPCFMCNETDATQAEINQAITEDCPDYFQQLEEARKFWSLRRK